MQISALAISRSKLNGDQGFSLIEILVALLLAALIFIAIPSSEDSKRHRDLQTAVDDIDRTIRFAASEAALRNTVVRLVINMEKMPIEYSVEYGPADNFILPVVEDFSKLSIKEQVKEKKRIAQLDGQFTKVEEFQDITREFSPEVELLGVATTFQKDLIRDQIAAIYFYPTGEKDGALFFFGTQDEVATLEVLPFHEKTFAQFFPAIPPPEMTKDEDIRENMMIQMAQEWFKK
jgi:prepilin-type N-terminal cleavage/methylation domain-containing protein